ncbi:MAG: hypothetical protein DRP78_06880 [Candidatus Omnitrophota bacterium]|nr:MAG: hypothetical protein DRP78_06880 [Candidatus Omnitrophota bacterium]
MSQGALYSLLNNIITNFNLCTAKLDADAGVTDTDYAANCDLSTLASRVMSANGIHQSDLAACLAEIETNFEILTAQLDADAGVTDTDYAASLDFDMNTAKIKANGIDQGSVVSYLQTVITAINGLLTKLDAD